MVIYPRDEVTPNPRRTMDGSKQTITVEEVVNDIRSGMNDQDLAAKYHLSPTGLLKLFRKLLSVGAVDRSEIVGREQACPVRFEVRHRFTDKLVFSGGLPALKDFMQSSAKSGRDLSHICFYTGTRQPLTSGVLDLSGIDLARARLAKANLSHVRMRRVKLVNADLLEADLFDVELAQADLSNSRLRRANLIRSDLTGANLTGADLSMANLVGAILTGCDLTDAKMSGAITTGRLGAAANDRIDLGLPRTPIRGRSASDPMAGKDGSTQIRTPGDRFGKIDTGSGEEAGADDGSSRPKQRHSTGKIDLATLDRARDSE